VEGEVKSQLEGSLAVACHVLNVNRELHERLSRQLLTDEKLEGLGLQQALEEVKVRGWSPGLWLCRRCCVAHLFCADCCALCMADGTWCATRM
jgi:hypothetical protein